MLLIEICFPGGGLIGGQGYFPIIQPATTPHMKTGLMEPMTAGDAHVSMEQNPAMLHRHVFGSPRAVALDVNDVMGRNRIQTLAIVADLGK